MKKIKIFRCQTTAQKLEDEINEWLSHNKETRISMFMASESNNRATVYILYDDDEIPPQSMKKLLDNFDRGVWESYSPKERTVVNADDG